MIQVNFTCPTKELLNRLNLVKAALPRRSKDRLSINLELDVYKSHILLVSYGAKFKVSCQRHTNSHRKVIANFERIYQLVTGTKSKEILIKCVDNEMTIGNTTIYGKILSTKESTGKSKIILSAKPTDKDFLKLVNQYTEQELGKHGLLLKIELAKMNLDKNVNKALLALEEYDISRNDLLNFIYEQLSSKK